MRMFQRIHTSMELGTRAIILSEKDILMDPTTPYEEYEQAMKLNIGEKMLIHFGECPVKVGNLIRLEDSEK